MTDFNPDTHNLCVVCGKKYSYRYIMGHTHYKCVCGLTCKNKILHCMGFFGLGWEIKEAARKMIGKRNNAQFWAMVHEMHISRRDMLLLGLIIDTLQPWDIREIMNKYHEENQKWPKILN